MRDEDEEVPENAADGTRDIPDDPRYELLDGTQRKALERAQDRWAEDEGDAHADDDGIDGLWPDEPKRVRAWGDFFNDRNRGVADRPARTDATCGAKIQRGHLAGQMCKSPAGLNTPHYGYGPCWIHGGSRKRGRAEGAWVAAHAFAQQLNINPWDALLMAVRIAAGKVSYCETVIGTAVSDLELEGRFERVGANDDGTGGILVHPDTGAPLGVGQYRDLSFWVKQSELWHDRLAKTSKMAVDAGIAAYEIQKVEAEAQRMARVLNAVIEGLDGKIDERLALEMRAIMRNELMLIDREESANAGMQAIESASVATAQHRESIDGTGSWEDER